MSGSKIVDLPYLIPRVVLWILLFAVALFDSLRHRHVVKRRGSQLQRGLIAVVFAFVVQDLLLLSFAVLSDHKSPNAAPVCAALIFFTEVAESSMIVRAHLPSAHC